MFGRGAGGEGKDLILHSDAPANAPYVSFQKSNSSPNICNIDYSRMIYNWSGNKYWLK
jgi:hypothetical protein